MEFLVHMEVGSIGEGPEAEKMLREQEALRARELARDGALVRLWREPGRRANWGIWRADNSDRLNELLAKLPLFPYLTITTYPLEPHPNDPEAAYRDATNASNVVSACPGTLREGV